MSSNSNLLYNSYRHSTNPSNNYVSTADTIELMRDFAYAAKDSEAIIAALNEAIEGVGACRKDGIRAIPNTIIANDEYLQCLLQIFNWVKSNVKFVEDEVTMSNLGEPLHPEGTELLIRPDLLLQMVEPSGDCDDFSTLLASMLLTTRSFNEIYFVTIAADKARPQDFTHVYLAVRNPKTGKLINMDASHGPFLDWEYPEALNKQYWKI